MKTDLEIKTEKRKKIIKRITMLFVITLIILTFFSNTIMNYSLAQVSTEMVSSESVSTKIRGNGIVEAAEPVVVKVTDTKTVEKILVKEGDEIKKGDVLITFKAEENGENGILEAELDEMKKSYESKILLEEIDANIVHMAENGGYSFETARTELENLRNSIKAAEDKLSTIQTQILDLEANATMDELEKEEKLEELNNKLAEAQGEVTNATEAHSKYLEDLTTIDGLKEQYEAILKKQNDIDNKKNTDSANEIKSSCDGTILSVNTTNGSEALADEELITIKDSTKGYTLNIIVTKEQAKKVKKGDEASIDNAWYYDDLKATLSSIMVDRSAPLTNKILKFDIEGDIEVGDNLSIAVGEKSATYDSVIPNSSVREDKNGKFVLTVEKKSSPLGNRYIAKRIGVEILASDDKNSAVKGDIEEGDYVISTANKSVKSGDYIRLAK